MKLVLDAFTLIGFPLNFKGRDGSPIRAVAEVVAERHPTFVRRVGAHDGMNRTGLSPVQWVIWLIFSVLSEGSLAGFCLGFLTPPADPGRRRARTRPADGAAAAP